MIMLFRIPVDRLVCSQTMEAGYQCRCRVGPNSYIPLNGTDCISKYELDTMCTYHYFNSTKHKVCSVRNQKQSILYNTY